MHAARAKKLERGSLAANLSDGSMSVIVNEL